MWIAQPALAAAVLVAALAGCAMAPRPTPPSEPMRLRVATYNASLYADTDGGLLARLAAGDEPARRIAAVVQSVRPDLLLLNEFDFDAEGLAADRFQRDYLGVGQHGREPIHFAHRYFAPVNTGVPSGLDIDGDGATEAPGDAWGYGRHPGQYGMLVLSRYPIDAAQVRSFRLFRWAAMPDALRPTLPDGTPFYADAVWSQLRLSSKSHWDVPVTTPAGTLHFLVAHPTPPVFDGPEDRNGRRNHDEIRIWADYVEPARASYLIDDAGVRGGLADGARFVIAGDLNADPNDGSSWPGAAAQLLEHPRIRSEPIPWSDGARAAAGAIDRIQRGRPEHDTGHFGESIGNLRIDYVLPSRTLEVDDARVFWPPPGAPGHELVDASDHHLVYVDLRL